jgi:choline dehydrogenase-like flavoprotein
MEQLPDPASRVVIADEPARLPRAELDWRISGDEWLGAARATRAVARQLEADGTAEVLPLLPTDGSAPPRLHKADHHMGTTRMDPDPRRGVVDEHGRVHETANLYVAGSSVFPTGGGANPMLTVLALTLRLAEHLGGGRRAASPDAAEEARG